MKTKSLRSIAFSVLLMSCSKQVAGPPAQNNFQIDTHSVVTNRQVYYKNSAYASFGGVSAALDSEKILLQSAETSQTTTFANVTNYTRGINGLVLDIAGLVASDLAIDDFIFRTGNTNTPSLWADAPAPTLISVTPATDTTAGRVLIEWADNAIQNTWLQIIVKANARTGLSNKVVYYLGHALAEVNGIAPYRTTNADLLAVQGAVSNEFVLSSDPRDVNKDRRVTGADISFVQGLISASVVLDKIMIPAAGSAGGGLYLVEIEA